MRARLVIGGRGDGKGRYGKGCRLQGMLRGDEGGVGRSRKGTERGLRNHGAALRGSSMPASSWVIDVRKTLRLPWDRDGFLE